MQVSQKAGQVVWYSHLLKNFPQFIVIHTVKGFGTDYLYDLGHRRIAYVGPDNGLMFSADRKSGYQLSLLQHQLPLDPEFCIEIDYQSSERPEQLCSLLQREDRPTAIVVDRKSTRLNSSHAT